MSAEAVRLDIWLWAARLFKTRALAKAAIVGGKVLIDDARCKPARIVKPGDRLSVRRGEELMELVVSQLAHKRGPASVAQTLYEETEESRSARELAREQRQIEASHLNHPGRKPDRRERSALIRVHEQQD